MEDVQGHFQCSNCENSEFMPIYSFSLHFHKVNFSEDVVCDELIVEKYKCTKCEETFTRRQIEARINELKRKLGGS